MKQCKNNVENWCRTCHTKLSPGKIFFIFSTCIFKSKLKFFSLHMPSQYLTKKEKKIPLIIVFDRISTISSYIPILTMLRREEMANHVRSCQHIPCCNITISWSGICLEYHLSLPQKNIVSPMISKTRWLIIITCNQTYAPLTTKQPNSKNVG